MKRLFLLVVLLFTLSSTAQTDITNGVMVTVDGTSYDSPYHAFLDYFATYVYSMNPGTTNDVVSYSRSGNSLDADWQSQQPQFCLPFWLLARTNQILDYFMITENGGYTSTNQVIPPITNLFAAPPVFYNGTARTNEAGMTMTVTHNVIGSIPDNGNNSNPGNQEINKAGLQAAQIYMFPSIDMWNFVYTPYWSNDFNLSQPLSGFYAGGHPYPAGHMCMASKLLLSQPWVQTNIWAMSVKYDGSGIDYASNCAISSQSLGHFKVKFSRQAPAWDIAGTVISTGQTITNDCRNFTKIMPFLGNAFNCGFRITGCPAGTYNIYVNGTNVDTCTDVQLSSGIGRNWYTNYLGQIWYDRVEILTRKHQQEGADCVTWLDAHQPGTGQFIPGQHDMVDTISQMAQTYGDNGNRGTNYARLMLAWTTDVLKYDNRIAAQAIANTNTMYDIAVIAAQSYQPAPFR